MAGLPPKKPRLFLLHGAGEPQMKIPLHLTSTSHADFPYPPSSYQPPLPSPPRPCCSLRISDEAVKFAEGLACRRSPRAIPRVIYAPAARAEGLRHGCGERGRRETAGDGKASARGREGNIWTSSRKSYQHLENTTQPFPLFISCPAPTFPTPRRAGARQLWSAALTYAQQRMEAGGWWWGGIKMFLENMPFSFCSIDFS